MPYNIKGAYINMKSTGIVHKLNLLGRIVLPLELRKTLNIEEKDPLEIFVGSQSIILSKYEPACIFCSSVKDNVNFKGKIICADCMEKLKSR
jgi:transcriptional pleiotropic regulator of transition state genes